MPSLYLPRPLPRLASPRRPFAPMKFPGTSASLLFPVPVPRLPSQSSLCLCALLLLSAAPLPPPARNRIFHSPISLSPFSRVGSPGNSDDVRSRDTLFKSRFVPGIRLEIARNFVEAVSSGLSRLAGSLTTPRNRNANLPRDPPAFNHCIL